MGRRKIEIKPIKDDRNRSVTFLKRKGGLFKKAHELSVLCSVDVAVFIFGNNKKLYEYSSRDMREMITRYQYHGPPNERKTPSDFRDKNNPDDEDDDTTPPQRESTEPRMAPPQVSGQAPFAQMRQHDPSASPPINGMPFQQQQQQQHHHHHHGHPATTQRGHTPQPPHMGSRPGSRQDVRRISQHPAGPAQAPPPQQPPQQANGYAYMPSPPIYNTQNPQQNPPHSVPHHGPPYVYPPNNHPQHPQHAQQQYVDDQRRSSHPPNYLHNQQAPHVSRISASPQPHPQQLPPHHHQPPPPPPQQQHHHQQRQQQHPPPPPPPPPPQQPHPAAHLSPRPPPPQRLESQPQPSEASMPAPMEIKRENSEQPPQPLLLTTDSIIKRPTRKQHSIFTPIDENRSILSQHLASFATSAESKAEAAKKNAAATKTDAAATKAEARSQSVDVGAVSRTNGATTASPPRAKPAGGGENTANRPRNVSVSSIPDKFPPPSRSSTGGGASRPSLRLEIPEEPSDGGGTATAASEVPSPRNQADAGTTQAAVRRPDGQASGMVLPPPSPSASALLSAGATGPPNPFARPPPQPNNNISIDTPASALPSRFLNSEFLPSPSSFDPFWFNRTGGDSNTLPSPLNFSTPLATQGPSFLREEASTGATKRKSPDISGNGSADGPEAVGGGAKRARIES